ncbi:KL precursor [Xenopus laevis]|uniref:Ig-like receptor 1 n=1 Tax=Xenopus laevis TaxID=8355 RepID=Q4VWT0_XENLA|nr:KL precursor [Xenopus laevis]AAQ63876.1 Ig-like receptor 1 [Xenopus laevis]
MLFSVILLYTAYTLQILAVGANRADPPLISVIPSPLLLIGNNVTIRCQGAEQEDKFILYKNGAPLREGTPAGETAEFYICNAQRKDAGNYFCMRKVDRRFTNHITIIVKGEDDIVQILALPSTSVSAGGNLTIQCQTAKQGDTFVLYKDVDVVTEQEPAGEIAQFHIYPVQPKDKGMYYCLRKSSQSKVQISSRIEVIIEGEDDIVQISALPSTNVSAGGNLTIQCQTAKQGDTFVLYKDDDVVSEQEPAGEIAQFNMYPVQPKDTGMYFCLRKSSQSDIKVSNEVEITIEGAGDEVSRPNADYTITNSVRLGLAGLLLLITIFLVIENCRTKKNQLQQQRDYHNYNLYSVQC